MPEKDTEITELLSKLNGAIDAVVNLYGVEYNRITVLFNGNYDKFQMLLKVFEKLEDARTLLSLYEFT